MFEEKFWNIFRAFFTFVDELPSSHGDILPLKLINIYQSSKATSVNFAAERSVRLIKFNNRDNRVVFVIGFQRTGASPLNSGRGGNYSGNIWRGRRVFESVVIYPRMFLKLCLGSPKVVKANVLVMSIDTSSIEEFSRDQRKEKWRQHRMSPEVCLGIDLRDDVTTANLA